MYCLIENIPRIDALFNCNHSEALTVLIESTRTHQKDKTFSSAFSISTLNITRSFSESAFSSFHLIVGQNQFVLHGSFHTKVMTPK